MGDVAKEKAHRSREDFATRLFMLAALMRTQADEANDGELRDLADDLGMMIERLHEQTWKQEYARWMLETGRAPQDANVIDLATWRAEMGR